MPLVSRPRPAALHGLRTVATAAAIALSMPLAGTASATVVLPSILSDGMVLQRESEVAIWGFARPGERVRVSGSWGGEVEAEGDARGRFVAMLPTAAAGGPFTVTIAGENTIVLSEVLVGEVWLASGQSNMEQKIAPPSFNGVENWEQEVAAADFPQIRFFDVENRVAAQPRSDARGEWVAVSPETAGSLSAVAFFFARDLHRALEVPVGVITADWGGTRIEAWMSPESLADFPAYAATLSHLEALGDPLRRGDAMASIEAEWWSSLDAGAPGGTAWKDRDLAADADGWQAMDLPATLAGPLASFDGVLWFRREVELPPDWPTGPATLELGPIDDRDDAFVNGVLVGSTRGSGQWSVPRRYEVPAGTLLPGRNAIAVRMIDDAGPGGINGRPEQMRLVAADGRTSVPLAGSWQVARGPSVGQMPPRPGSGLDASVPTVLHRGMIEPIRRFTVRGYLWYQGESNRDNAAAYADLLAAMAEDWRGGDASRPFLIVQIAPFRYGGDRGETARVRESQRVAAASIPNAGLVVTMDVGDPLDIHPVRKRPVGERLARLALAQAYGREIVAEGPRFAGWEPAGSGVRIFFTSAEGLVAKGGEIRGVLLAGEDRRWHRGLAVIDGETVVAMAPEVPRPVAVRYLWGAALEAELFNGAGLPASPFRSDSWEGPFGGPEHPVGNESEMERLRTTEAGFEPLFNGENLDGWVVVNGAPSTWQVKDGVILCSGFPTGVMRTEGIHENFILELEYRHLVPGGNAGLFIWSDPLPVRGQPFTRSIEVQVMDGLEQSWFTSDGDVFPIHGARMTPRNGRGGDRAFPTERRSNPAPMWNHYRVECIDGSIRVSLNGRVVTQAVDASPRRGYICLESEGSPIEFRQIRIKELPPAEPPLPTALAAEVDDRPWICLYNGVDLAGWKADASNARHWKVQDWILSYDGQGTDLWSEQEFGDFELICDWRFPGEAKPTERPVIGRDGQPATAPDGTPLLVEVPDAGDSGIYLRGSSKSQVNIWCWPVGSGEVFGYRTDPQMPDEVRAAVTPSEPADRPIGQWNRFRIVMKGDRLTVELNGRTVVENALLPGVPPRGPIALQHHGDPIQFANIYIRELD